jgi:hypothetical protein
MGFEINAYLPSINAADYIVEGEKFLAMNGPPDIATFC